MYNIIQGLYIRYSNDSKKGKGNVMKNIWSWILLLFLLILFCVWTKKDSIHISSDTAIHAPAAQSTISEKNYIEYSITQVRDGYALNGNFTDTRQQNSLSDTCTAAASSLTLEGTTTNSTLEGKEAISLTNTILPHFIANYSNGKITYRDEILVVSGNVKGYEAKHTMQTLLSDTTIATQDETKVLLVEPINFVINKNTNQFQLSGTFTNQKQIHALSKFLRPTYSTVNLRKNSHRIDKGAIALTKKILPTFSKNYSTGKIKYTHETLIVEGIVENQDALDTMNSLLSNASIPVENLTILNPEIAKRAEAEKRAKEEARLAALAKVQAAKQAKEKEVREAEEKARLEAEKAKAMLDQEKAEKQKAEEKARLKLEAIKAKANSDKEAKLAKEEATRKSKAEQKLNEARKAKLATEAAKINISKLLKIENIEFEVAKGSLTTKGKNTVDKLANILKQYANIKVEVAGHTDSDGSAIFNQKLSQSRVDTVKNRLISKGINSGRLTAKGYGESKPLVANTSDVNKAKNRRVEINIQGE